MRYSRKENPVLRFLHKKGSVKEVEELEALDRVLETALNNGEITLEDIQRGDLPSHYRDVFDKHIEIQQTLNTRFDREVIKARSSGKEKEFFDFVQNTEKELSPEERREQMEIRHQNNQKLIDEYVDNPVRENAIEMVKQVAFEGDVEEWSQRRQKEREEKDQRAFQSIEKKVFDDTVASVKAELKRASDAKELVKNTVDYLNSDKRMRSIMPSRKSEFWDKVQEAVNAPEPEE